MKAISGVLFLLLKHFKLNHVYQVRCQNLELFFRSGEISCLYLVASVNLLSVSINAFEDPLITC